MLDEHGSEISRKKWRDQSNPTYLSLDKMPCDSDH